MKQKPIIIANWKMNKTNSEALFFVEILKQVPKVLGKANVILASSFTTLSDLNKALVHFNTEKQLLSLAAQNMHFEKSGAFTGEVSCKMIKEVGCKYVLAGHSERRKFCNESNALIQKKVKYALDNDVIPVLCIGESFEERKAKNSLKVIHTQLEECLAGLKASEVRQLIIAYEPVWAISTGGTAEHAMPLQIQEIHAFIRAFILEKYGKKIAQEITIIFGGSVNEHNVQSYLSLPDVQGALVGGASLDVDTFIRLLKNI